MIHNAEQLIDFWKRALSVHSCVYFRGAIPEDKLAAACEVYGLVHAESVLVLYDDTVFGGGSDGWVLTASHFGFRAMGHEPQFLPFKELEPDAVEYDGRELVIRGEKVEMTGGDVAVLREEVVEALRKTLHGIDEQGKGSPYRNRRHHLPPQSILESLKKLLPKHDDIYFQGDIPARMLRNVVKLYEINDPNEVLVLYDDTIFGSAKEGLVITHRRICFKGIGEGPVSVELRILSVDDIEYRDGALSVKGKKVEITGDRSGLTEKFGLALQGMLCAGTLRSV